MVISLTPMSENQLKKTLNVALWLGGSVLVSWVLSRLSKHPGVFVSSAPLINLVGVTLKQFFTEEEQAAEKQAPGVVQEVASEVDSAVQ